MRFQLKPILWTVAAVFLSALTAFIVARFTSTQSNHAHASTKDGSVGNFHEWLHSELRLTPGQESELAPIEAAYEKQRLEMLARIRLTGQKLAASLDESPEDAGAINHSLMEINKAQGELQRATIEHFLEMKKHLTPAQSLLLLQWTRQSITHDHRH